MHASRGESYLREVRKLTEAEISAWHLTASDDEVQIPVLDFTGTYIFTARRHLGQGKKTYDYPSSAPVAFNLFGIEKALPTVLESGVAILVEGFFDCIMMHRVGFTSTMAIMSNCMTRWQAVALRRWTTRVVLALDGDEGGKTGLKRSSEALKFVGFDVAAVSLSQGDPDWWLCHKHPGMAADFAGAVRRAIRRVNGT